MKKLLHTTLLTIACLLCSIGMMAEDFESGGIYYNITSSTDKTVAVTYYGTDLWSVPDEYRYTGAVVIPESVTYNGVDYSVTAIGDYAFLYCEGLTEITIPNSVTSIGEDAFRYCEGLTEITIPNSVTKIGDYAFEGCLGLTEITIPNSVTSIGEGTFSCCHGLTEITIPNSVTAIGGGAFNSCSGLTEITIGNGVTSIGGGAFFACKGLTEITIPESVTAIGGGAFEDCSNLTQITTLATTPATIYENTFMSVPYESIYLCVPKGCRSVYQEAQYWSNFTNIFEHGEVFPIGTKLNVDGIHYNVTSNTDKTVEVRHSSYTGAVVIPESVTYNGVDYSVTAIGDYAFNSCWDLTEITIPNSVTSIGISAFNYCSGLTEITIPESVTSIGGSAFDGTPYYDNMPDGVIYLGKTLYKYKGEMPENTTIAIEDGTVSISDGAFYECSGLTEITIPESVTSIGDYSFYVCSGLTEITIPESVTSIGDYAFFDCTGLTEIIIPNSITSIGDYSFCACTGLTEITIPESVTSIGEAAFRNCWGLTEITIPNSVTSIGDYAFYGCKGLTQITTLATTPATIYENTFWGVPYESISLFVPKGCRSVYQETQYWSNFTNIFEYGEVLPIGTKLSVDGIHYNVTSNTDKTVEVTTGSSYIDTLVIPESVTYNGVDYSVTAIGDIAFNECWDLTEITIPNSVTSIGISAFNYCSGLTSVTIPNSVTSIGDGAFSYCTGLTSITIPDSITSISDGMLAYCTSLTSIDLTESITSIGNEAFSGCSGLTEITIPNSVTKIGYAAFLDCTGLTEITIPDSITSISDGMLAYCTSLTSIDLTESITSIGNNAFSGCAGLTEVTIPNSVTSIGVYSFSGCTGLTKITSLATTPPTLADKTVFDDDTYDYIPLYVRYDCKATYKGAAHWGRFAQIEEMASDNHFEVEAVSASRGSEFTLPISLVNLVAISGFQADLYLPAGVDIKQGNEEKSVMLSERGTSSHIISVARQSDGSIRIIAYSTKAEAFEGNEGVLFNILLDVSSNFNGDCKLALKNIVLTTPDDSEYSASDLNIDVTIVAPEKGDANSDGKVNVSDINAVANYILRPEISHINITQADVATNGKINVIDLVGIANIILGEGPQAKAPRRIAGNYAANENRFYIEDFNIEAGTEKEVAILLDNSVMFSAFQVDILMPEGLSIKQEGNEYKIQLTDRSNGHIISTAKQKDGTIRILSYSTSSKEYKENSGALVTLTVVANENFSKGDIVVKNILFSQADMTEFELPDTYTAINGNSRVTSIALDKDSVNMVVGDSLTLVATITPDSVTNSKVAWSSSNTAVATVDSVGNVVAVAEGTAIITVATTDGSNLTAQCVIEVKQASGINNTNAECVAITVENGKIVVKNAPIGSVVNIYTITGSVAATAQVAEPITRVTVNAQGIYIVRVDNTVKKVVL